MGGYGNDYCIICGKGLTYQHLTPYCQEHYREFQRQETLRKWKETGDTGCGVSTTIRNVIRQYIYDKQNNQCAICGIPREWNGLPINFILDHIDGDASHNKEDNLRLICPNCDSQLPTYKSRNKNSARTHRKNYMGNEPDRRAGTDLKSD